MRPDYKDWLEEERYDPNTIAAQLHRAGRVEDCYGNLDQHFAGGTLQSIIDELTYSADDERRGKPNPSKIPFQGNIRNNLASYKNAVVRYRKFLSGGWERSDEGPPVSITVGSVAAVERDVEFSTQRLTLERDMQAALRLNITQLSDTLSIIDEGAERAVASGFIDITCEDRKDNALVVIELKAGKADGRSVAQILGYMGDLAEEEPGRLVRGILIAHEFDQRSRSAARVVSSVELTSYGVEFRFSPER